MPSETPEDKAHHLLDDLHHKEGGKEKPDFAQFEKDWKAISKDQRAAVEAEFQRLEKATEILDKGAQHFQIVDKAGKPVEVDTVTHDSKGNHLKTAWKETTTATDAGAAKPHVDDPAAARRAEAERLERQRQDAERTAAHEKAENETYAKQYLGLLRPPATAADQDRFKEEYNKLPLDKQKAIGKAMFDENAKEDTAHAGDPAYQQIKVNLGPDGRVATVTHPEMVHPKHGQPTLKQAVEYQSPDALRAEAAEVNKRLHLNNSDMTKQFEDYYKGLSPQEQQNLAVAMKQTATPDETVMLKADGTLDHVFISPPGGQSAIQVYPHQKSLHPPKLPFKL